MSAKLRPGTVSNILWHFTGGPEWDGSKEEYKNHPKDEEKSYKALCGIIESKTLKVGSFSEKIHIDGQLLTTKKVACVADIPMQFLSYHAIKYGKFAIGFRRKSLLDAQFNPVFYVAQDKLTIVKFSKALESIAALEEIVSESSFTSIMLSASGSATDSKIAEINRNISAELSESLEEVGKKMKVAKEDISLMLAFMKTLDKEKDFESLFHEREWRNTSDYSFDTKELAMIIVPQSYLDKFINSNYIKNIPRNIPVMSFEDLAEH